VIETLGHLPGHLSFLDERDGTLYAGDAVVGIGGLLIPGNGPWWFPLLDLFSWNKEIALASARKLCGYPIVRFATGHLGVREGGVARLEAVLAKVGD
jgi:glyoxylase-like metal-dependent hydrolase (beta-lactamase superfamily II)